MTATKKDPVVVVLQMSGGNDYFNTVIPYADPRYMDNRPAVGVNTERVIKLNDKIGFHPEMGPFKNLYDQGNVAIIHGVGYHNAPRSHFRSMDIWHTCEPDKLGTEGWLGRAAREIDPNKENVVTAVSFGPSLPRALVLPGVPVSCVDDLDNFGMLTGITEDQQRNKIIDRFSRLYSPTIGSGFVMDYLGQTGLDALKGTGILTKVMGQYKSDVEYADNSFAKAMRGAAAVIQADIGTPILYAQHGTFDAHTNGIALQEAMLNDVSGGIQDFYSDIKASHRSEEVIMLVFSEFGRRVKDNGNGTDHGAGGVAFIIGDPVKGGQYGEYPSMKAEDLQQGDLVPNLDYRGLYSTVLEDWLGLDAKPIVKGTYEKPKFL